MRPGRLLSAAVCGLTAALLLPAGLARANTHGRGWADTGEGTVEVGAEGGAGSHEVGITGATTSGAAPVCEWERVPDDHIVAERWADTGEEVVLYFMTCPGEPRQIVPVRDGDEPGSPITARERARELLVLPTPEIELNPAEPVVHTETWLWVESVEWSAQSESATAAGVTATVTATPRRVVWEMGNGDVVLCDGPGHAYDSSRPSDEQSTDCSYVWRHSSADRPNDAYVVTATVEWEVSWTVVGAEGGGALPLLTTSDSASVQVGEIQAINEERRG